MEQFQELYTKFLEEELLAMSLNEYSSLRDTVNNEVSKFVVKRKPIKELAAQLNPNIDWRVLTGFKLQSSNESSHQNNNTTSTVNSSSGPQSGKPIGVSAPGSSQELLLQQALHFETLRHQLVEQQRAELQRLMDEQRRQQQELQNDMQMQEKRFRDQCDRILDLQRQSVHTSLRSTLTEQSILQTPPISAEVGNLQPETSSRVENSEHDVPTSKAEKTVADLLAQLSDDESTVVSEANWPNNDALLDNEFIHFVSQLSVNSNFLAKWQYVTAAAKGWLVRRLLQCDKVSVLLKTLSDTKELISRMNLMSHFDESDQLLYERVTAQMLSARNQFHQIFFSLSPSVQARLLSQKSDRNRRSVEPHNLSAATLKARARREKTSSDKPSSPLPQRRPKRVDSGLRNGVVPKREKPPVIDHVLQNSQPTSLRSANSCAYRIAAKRGLLVEQQRTNLHSLRHNSSPSSQSPNRERKCKHSKSRGYHGSD